MFKNNLPMNQDIINEIKNQDYTQITGTIERFVSSEIKNTGLRGAVIGLSGGIDSAVLAYICMQNQRDSTLALIMPDTKITPESETADALNVASLTGIHHKLIDINPIVSQYATHLEPDTKAGGNLRARIRASILYYYANHKNYLALGSSDKSEYMTGYFTKFGDGASDVTPIVSLYKLQVREIARYLGVPDNIIAKKSSPHLLKGHGAEEELGASYEEVDSVLFCLYEKGLSVDQTEKITGIDPSVVKRVQKLYENSKHKRVMPGKPKVKQ